MSGNWLDVSSTSGNRFLSTYVKGFVDVSGGNVLLRAGPTNNNHLILQGGDISLNGRLFVTKDASLNGNVYVKGNIASGGAASIGGSLSIAGGITPLYSTPSFGPGQVGYVYNYSYPTSVTSGANSFNITVPAGVYIAFAYFEVATNQTNNNFYHELKQDGSRMAIAFCPQNGGANYQYLTAISAVCVCTNTSTNITQYINVIVNTNLLDCRFKVARIA